MPDISIKQKIAALDQTLKNIYIDPFAKLTHEINLLKQCITPRAMHNTLLDTNAWLKAAYKTHPYLQFSPEQALERLTLIYRYLTYTQHNAINSVMLADYQAKIQCSLPYFEWSIDVQRWANTDLLGKFSIYCFVATLEQLEVIRSLDHLLKTEHFDLMLIIIFPQQVFSEKNLLTLPKTILPVLDQTQSLAKRFHTHYQSQATLSLKTVFTPAHPIGFLSNQDGILIQTFSKIDPIKIQETLQTYVNKKMTIS